MAATTTIQTTSARPHRVLLRFLLCALILVAIVPRAFPFALATTTDTDGVVEFGKSAAVDGDSKIAEFGGNATSPDNLAELGYELAELGDSGFYQWNYDNCASDCYTLTSGNRWSTAHVRNGDACYRTCGSLGRVLGGYGRFCKDARAEREYTNLPPHQKVKVEFKVVSIDGKEWSNKKFKLQYDSTTHWFGNVDKNQGGRSHICGGSSNNANDRDGVHTYSREFSHSSDSLKLLISSNLATKTCETSSWALSYVKIYLNNMPPPPSPPPPPPSPPSPSPPPPSPSPPPPGRRDEPTVEILNAQKVVSNREFDFGISVSHPTCANSKSCFESEDDITSNQQKGLRCDVRVQAKEQTSCSKYGEYLPCMQWNSFYDSKKTAQTRKTLRVTKKDGQIQSGDIEIRYRCYFLNKGSSTSKATGTDTGEQILHTFKVAEGCSEWLASSRIHIGDLFLQSSPEFLNADCDKIHLVKESLFRKFDVNPLDGVLSLDEVRAAFSAHDVDTGYLEHVAKTTTDFSDQGGILLSKIIQSAQLPTRCFSIDSEANAAKSTPIYIRSATYPTSRAGEETTAAQCEAQKGLVSVSWDYSKVPGDSDYQCAYADGRLYEKFNGAAVRTLTDIRPAVGTGDSKVTLVAQLTFDDNDLPFMSTQGNNGYAGNKWKDGFTIEACGDGIKCAKRKNKGFSQFIYGTRRALSSSGIMMWFLLDSSTEQSSGGSLFLRDTNDGTYVNRVILSYDSGENEVIGGYQQLFDNKYTDNSKTIRSGKNSIASGTWHHVAMTINGVYGLSVFVDGDEKASMKDFDHNMVDFPHFQEKPKVFYAKLVMYDDFRIYQGVVSPAMLKAIAQCGRTKGCAELGYANPQSRRTYCIVAHYADDDDASEISAVPPCATALFFTGAAIDLALTPSNKGMLFSFRDTALDEIGFEVLRRSVSEGSATGIYDSVVLIDSSLSGCASKFNSITFFDYEAIETPGAVWEYAIRTKYPKTQTLDEISDPVTITSPWRSTLEGSIYVAGNEMVPVRNVRVCATITSPSSASAQTSHRSSSNLASHMMVIHSNPDKVVSGFQITDGFSDSFSTLTSGESFKIDLMSFYAVSTVTVEFAKETSVDAVNAANLDVRILDYDDPKDNKNVGTKGSSCKPVTSSGEAEEESKQKKYACVGTTVTSFNGQFVTILQKNNDLIKVAEIIVEGRIMDCPYSSFTDEDGHYEIEVMDASGVTPKKTRVSVKAYQTDVYDAIYHKDFFHSHDTSKNQEIRVPETAIIALEVYDGALIAPYYGDYDKGNKGFRTVKPCKCKDGSELREVVIDDAENDVYICAKLCTECGNCAGFDRNVKTKRCRFTNGKTGGDGAHVQWSGFQFWRKLSKVKATAITDENIHLHVRECLAEAPKDGMCYRYGFSSNTGPMPSWDVKRVTTMNGLFKGNAEINADLSDWDVSQVTDIREMFRDAVNFNQHLKDWKLSSSVTSEDAFAGALSFQAKFTNCTSATNGPPSSCELKRRMNRLEFAEYVSTQRSAFMNTKVIVTDEVWATFDTNGDGDLDDAEYARANRLMRYGYVSGTPWLVYSSKEMKNIRSFDVIRPKVSGNEPIKISADGAAETKSFLPCDAEVDKDGYYLIFKHDSSEGDFWLNSDEAKHFGVSSSTEKKYSRLDEISKYGKSSSYGGFQFKLEYPQKEQSYIWRQTSNPAESTKRGVDGYKSISTTVIKNYKHFTWSKLASSKSSSQIGSGLSSALGSATRSAHFISKEVYPPHADTNNSSASDEIGRRRLLGSETLSGFKNGNRASLGATKSLPTKREKHCSNRANGWALKNPSVPTCDDGVTLPTSGISSDEAVAKCGACSGCTAVSYKHKCDKGGCEGIRYTSGCGGGKGCLTGWKAWTTYRDLKFCGAIANGDFQTHVNGCLSESPVDGLCYKYGADKNIGPMPHWDVSKVTSMGQAFSGKSSFNGDLSNWDVSSVTAMWKMFYKASEFNRDISNWDVSKVTDMNYMFRQAKKFNQDIGSWDVSKVTNVRVMFYEAYAFNQDISKWDVSKVTRMDYMFYKAHSFNQDISKWDVSKVTDMSRMFEDARAFTGFVGGWNDDSVTSHAGMFKYAHAFQAMHDCEDANDGPASSCEVINAMFEYAPSFVSGTVVKDTSSSDASIGDAYLSSSGCIKAEPTFGVFESLCGHFGSKASFASVIKTPKVDLRSFRGFTLEAYVMFTDSPSNQYIFGHGKGSKRSGLHIGVRPGKGIYFGFYGDDLNYDFTPSLDVWYHLVFTYENSGSFTKCIYVDGVLKKSGSGGKYAYSGSNKQLLIGRAYGPDVSTSRGFTGEMAYARGFTAALNSKGVEYLYSQKPDATGGVFKGLEYNEGSSTFLDGSIGHSTWYYAVGAFKEFKTRQFPGPTPDSVNLVKLWLKTDMKKMKNCANHYDLLYNRDGVIDRLAFIPTFSSSVPVLTQSWDTWYSSYAERGEKIRLGKPTFQKQDALYSIVFSNGAQPILPQSSAHAIPVIGNNVTRVRFDKSVSGDALSFASLISRVAFNPISVNAVEQMSDLVHQYDKKKSKNQAGNDEEPASLGRKSKSISRLGSEEENSQSSSEDVSCANNGVCEKDFSDDSAVKVNGIVIFEPWKTQGYACGLPFAKIQAYSFDENEQGYVHEGTYFSDTSGRFEIGVPIGEGRTFVVHGDDQDVKGHTICYVGNSVDIKESDECVSPGSVVFPAPGEGSSITSSSYFEVAAAEGGENLVFLDTSTRSVDIGLYAGSCDSQYEEYELLITPANGCGAAAVVTYDDIQAWQCVGGSVGQCNGNERTWPYAAMDYYIQIEMAPDVSRMDVAFIRATTVGAGATCEAGTEIMQYFRNRDMLVQTVLLLDLESATVAANRYEYHGYLCSVITREDGGGGDGNTNAPTTIFHALSSSSESCLSSNTDPDEGDLTSNYLIGTTMRDNGRTIDASKRVGVKVFEAHYTSTGDTFTTCSDFQSSTTNIVVQIKDGITGGDNTCHPSKAPSEECKFSSVLATGDENVGFVDFGDMQYSREISSGSAIPNLVTPYRRSFSAHIERNDGWAITSMTVERELVVLTSKTRGEGGKPEDRYVSNSEFYATAPVQGLVYTVVHDPPGGNSFSSISKGTKIDLEMGLTTTRAAEKTSEWGFAAGLSVEAGMGGGIAAGSGYLNLEVFSEHNGARFESGVHGGYAQEGPTVTISGETDNGWDFHMTLDRNLESSQDPAIPGRPGDVILGGGFEIVYVRSDKVDFQSDTSHCLGVVPIIEWKGRKPTTYVMTVFSIEYKILPELINLISVTNNETSGITDTAIDDSTSNYSVIRQTWKSRLEKALDDWKRTLEWSSPDFNPEGFNALSEGEKEGKATEIQTRFDAMRVPFTSNDSVYGQISKPLITSVYGAYTQNDDLSPDYTAKKDWEELSEVWDSIPSDNAPLHGVPKIRRTDAWKNDGGQEANGKAAAIGPQIMLQASNGALFPLTPLAAVMGTVIDRMVNPNPEAYLDDKVKIIVEGTGEESHDPNGRWFPTKSDKWLSSYEPGGTGDDGRNLFNSNEDDPDKDEGLWSRGMSNYAKTEMKATFPDSIGNMDSSMVDASLFGGQAQFGFTGDTESGDTESTPTISDQGKQDVYLSFSGGGHNLEFSSSIESNIDSYGYSWSMEAEGSVSASTDFNMAVGVWELEAELADTYGKSIGQEKVLAWAKYGEMEVTYTLGDDDPYDKFVIQVSNDKRFGTPLFRTIGGSSKCPGEPNTMWRESGLGIEAKHAAGSDNYFVLPGKPALFDVIITNDSPYREGHIYGLLLTSNETNGGSSFSGGNMLDLKFSINGDNTKLRPFGDLLPLHDVPSTDDTGNSINTKLTLSVEKGNLSNEYAGIFLKLVSECEWQMSRDLLYRDPISDAYSLDDIKWQRECPEIAWDETTVNKYLYYIASGATSDVLDVSVMNPNPLNIWTSDKYNASDTVRGGWDVNKDHLVHPNVEFVRVQFRRPGIGEWISAWDDSKASANVTCGHSTSGCGLSWNLTKQYFMNGLRDGSWEIRAKIFCSGGASTAPMSVFGSTTKENLNLVVDVTSPKPIALSVMDKLFVVEYTEPVICPQLKTDEEIYQVTRIEDCDGTATEEVIDWTTILLQYSFRCIEDKINAWTMQLPSDLDNQGKYQIVVGKDSTSGLTDVGGNVVAKMTFAVDFCSASATVAVVSSSSSSSSSSSPSLTSTNAVAAKSAAAVGNSKRSRRNKTDTQNERVKGKNAASSELGVVKDGSATSNLFTFAPSTLLAGVLATTVVSATIAFTIARRISHPLVTSIDGDSPYEDKKPLLESTIPEQPAYGSVI